MVNLRGIITSDDALLYVLHSELVFNTDKNGRKGILEEDNCT